MPSPPRRQWLWSRPSTSRGRRALWLAVCGLALQPLTAPLAQVTPVPENVGVLSALGLLAIIVGGVFATIAIARRGEESMFVVAILVVWLFVLFLLIGKLAFPH